MFSGAIALGPGLVFFYFPPSTCCSAIACNGCLSAVPTCHPEYRTSLFCLERKGHLLSSFFLHGQTAVPTGNEGELGRVWGWGGQTAT